MCLRSSFDRFAIPTIYDDEGITTMPVCLLLDPIHWRVQRTDGFRFLDAVVPPAWSVGTLFGSFPANAAHSVARLSVSLASLVLRVTWAIPFPSTRVLFDLGSIGEYC
ncbi:hypothetical protein E8E13_002141 [Curvularia kusanoi]|uniref:Uncharacterized protein n=1 Tax=Curvularia kusanoi TaxID=90978 RepID=A0A9P4TE30_CURKU|nr:hypothetical protein E8E13_002141 [Curvularia kusanoi]